MNPDKEQLIQIRFHNGIFFDAIVEEWSDQKSVLKLPGSNDKVIIQKTLQDVLLIRILNNKNENTVPDTEILKQKFDELSQDNKTFNNLSQMAKLKDELNNIEREEIRHSMRSPSVVKAKPINYGIPRNLQIDLTPQHSIEETTPTNPAFDTELQDLFSKKY